MGLDRDFGLVIIKVKKNRILLIPQKEKGKPLNGCRLYS